MDPGAMGEDQGVAAAQPQVPVAAAGESGGGGDTAAARRSAGRAGAADRGDGPGA